MENEKVMSPDKKTSKMNIALSSDDKKFLKIYAAERETSVAALIHEYVEQLRKETGNK